MKQYKRYKSELDPNNIQKTSLKKNVGAARWAFNWALEKKKEALDKKVKIPTKIDLSKQFTPLKGKEIFWAYECSKWVFQSAFLDCDAAFANFFRNHKKNGFPKFKSKKGIKQSFRVDNVKVFEKLIQLPKIGKIKLKEKNYLPQNVKIFSATVSCRADRWFVSVLIEEELKEQVEAKNKVIGVDLGIKSLAICSDGTIFENPKALKKNLRNLKRKQRKFSKKQKGSNKEKARKRLAKLHFRISNIRKDCLHKTTSKIVNENQVIVLEDLKVSNMINNHKLAQAISDVGMYEFRRQIEYKSKWKGRVVVFVDTFYPSSKLCSKCNWKKEDLKLSDRIFKCENCGNTLDRDLNAAKNLEKFYIVGSTKINACGDESFISKEI